MGMHVEEGTFKGYDGAELFFQTWPVEAPKAVILGIHGLGEHVESYGLLVEGLEGTGYQLVMSDLRGHGRSSGKRGVSGIDEFVRDIKVFHGMVKDKFSHIPLFFLGHSMGGLILIKLLIRHGDLGARGAVLSSPLLGVTVKVPALKRKSAGFLSKITPNLTLSNEIPNDHLTLNKEVVQSYENDHLRHDRISSLLFIEILSSIDYVFQQSDKIKLPVLLQQAGDDLVVSRAKAIEYFEKLKCKDKKKIVYEGFYHEIYNEIYRKKPYGDLIHWLDGHLK